MRPRTEAEDRLGEAVEAYLERLEQGTAPDPEDFVRQYPDVADELREALDGLALVQGLVGSGSGPGAGHRHLEAGHRIAGYRIMRELGRGGMGAVYEAMHVDLDRPVALKVLGGHAAPGSTGRRRFLNEAKTAASLHHTHIVPVFDVGQFGGLCYYAMQRIEGTGLDRVLRVLKHDRVSASASRGGATPVSTAPRSSDRSGLGLSDSLGLTGTDAAVSSWPPRSRFPAGRESDDDRPRPYQPPTGQDYYRWAAHVGRQAAEALAYAHRRGVIHRDVKPSNLLVDGKGNVWVADFGLARRLEDPGHTHADSLLGTPRYMSPEQAEGAKVDYRTDVYSLGATLYELVTLRPPFDGQSTAELVRQITGKEPIPPRRFARRLPRDLETIILKAMAKRPSDRYPSAQAFADDLQRFLEFEPVRARRIGPVGRLWRLSRRHPWPAAITTLAAVVILAVATIAYVRVNNARNRALDAQADLAKTLEREKEANRNEKLARINELLSQLPLLRDSSRPDQRAKGRDRLEAVSLLANEVGLNPAMNARFRDEAIALLAERDVERRFSLPTGEVDNLVPIHWDKIAVIPDSGDLPAVWDIERRELVETQPQALNHSDPAEDESSRERLPRWVGRFNWPRLAAADSALVSTLNNGPGLRLTDPRTGDSSFHTLDDSEVLAVWASPKSDRIVTIERDWPVGQRRRDSPPLPRVMIRNLRRLDDEPIRLEILQLADEPENAAPPEHKWPHVAIDPDLETVAVCWDLWRALTVFDADTGAPLLSIDTGVGLSALALGPEGLLAAAGDSRVQLWELRSDDDEDRVRAVPLPVLSAFQGYVRLLRFSLDGRLLAVSGRNTGVELWDIAANTPVATVPTPEWVEDILFLNRRMVFIASGKATEGWSIAEPVGLYHFEFPGNAFSHRRPFFGPDSTLVLPMANAAPLFWKPSDCPTRSLPWDDADVRAAEIAYDPQGHLLVITPRALTRYQEPLDDEPIDRLEWPTAPHEDPHEEFISVTRSPNHQALLVARKLILSPETESGPPSPHRRRERLQLLLWRATEDGPGRVDTVEFQPEPPRPHRWRPAAFSADATRLFLIDESEALQTWAFRNGSGTAVRLPRPPVTSVASIGVDPQGRRLAVGLEDGSILLLDAATGARINAIPPRSETEDARPYSEADEARPYTALAFSRDGALLAAGSGDGRLRLWSINTFGAGGYVRLFDLPGPRGHVADLSFSPDGRYLTCVDFRLAGTGGVEVWDLDALKDELAPFGFDW